MNVYATIDLRNAFTHIRLTDKFAEWFCYELDDKYYKFKTMMFGMKVAPYI